jgi:hypothetical protein
MSEAETRQKIPQCTGFADWYDAHHGGLIGWIGEL